MTVVKRRDIEDEIRKIASWRAFIMDGEGPGSKAMRAEMRRCRTVGEALMTEAFSNLFRRLVPDPEERTAMIRMDGFTEKKLSGWARAAIAAIAVETDERGRRFGRQMAGPDADRPFVSAIVAKGFLSEDDPDLALGTLLGILSRLKGKANFKDVCRLIGSWGERQGERERRSAIMAYYDAGPDGQDERDGADAEAAGDGTNASNQQEGQRS